MNRRDATPERIAPGADHGAAGQPARLSPWWRGQTLQTIAGMLLLTVLVLWYRRPDQFSHPYIWVEDGTTILSQYLQYGWRSLFHPTAGYFIAPTKLIHTLSVLLSFRWFPEISCALAIVFSAYVVCCVALAPTVLKYPRCCAIAILLLPTGSEVFAVSEYALWWGGLLLFLPLLWQPRGGALASRTWYVLLGGFSSPLVVFLAPLYVLRAVFTRQRIDLALALLAALIAAIQLGAVFCSGQAPAWAVSLPDLHLTAGKFIGWYVFCSFDPDYFVLSVLLHIVFGSVLLACAWPLLRRPDGSVWLLCTALGLCIAASTLRAPLLAMDPYVTAPRYFFYPYLLLSWLLLQSLDSARPIRRALAMFALGCACLNFVLFSPWHHATLDWRAQVEDCLQQPEVMFKIHFQGRADSLWGELLSQAQCRALVHSSLFDNRLAPGPVP